jgi:hypothetical protein
MLIVNGTELVDLVVGKVKAYTDKSAFLQPYWMIRVMGKMQLIWFVSIEHYMKFILCSMQSVHKGMLGRVLYDIWR